jgi:hypothetical protein
MAPQVNEESYGVPLSSPLLEFLAGWAAGATVWPDSRAGSTTPAKSRTACAAEAGKESRSSPWSHHYDIKVSE